MSTASWSLGGSRLNDSERVLLARILRRKMRNSRSIMRAKNKIDQFTARKIEKQHRNELNLSRIMYKRGGRNREISQKNLFLHIFCNITRPHLDLIGLYLGGIVVT